jgi:plasmid stabilization system protein ParE
MAKSKYRLRVKPTFLSDLDNVLLHIAEISGSTDTAMRFFDKINAEIANRLDFAEAFERFYPYEGSPCYYRIYIGSYTIFYIVSEGVMEVRRLLYSGADYASHLE